MSLPIKCSLPNGFLEEEVRCGYKVTEKLKRIWAVELDLLQELLRVCRKHDIKVQVFAGTLLGAVRHKGFIPWDDDMDVCLTRSEFDKLVSVAEKEFAHPYFLQTALSDRRYFCPYARLRNSDTTGVIHGHETGEYNNGIYIDVFVLEGYSRSHFAESVRLFLQHVAVKLLSVYNDSCARKSLRVLAHLFSYERLVRFYVWTVTFFSKKSSRLGLRHMFNDMGRRYSVRRETLEDSVELPFEGIAVPAPRMYDMVLREIYGDYEKFPPVEQRGVWHEGKIRFEPDLPYSIVLKNSR